MSQVDVLEVRATAPNPTNMVHIEDPSREGHPLCGASVQGVYTLADAECAVCAEMWLEYVRGI